MQADQGKKRFLEKKAGIRKHLDNVSGRDEYIFYSSGSLHYRTVTVTTLLQLQ
jgi:hypothetical protein